MTLYYTALYNRQGIAQEDSKDNKGALDFRLISGDGKTSILVLFTSFYYSFEKS
jgi:hypothetical protein